MHVFRCSTCNLLNRGTGTEAGKNLALDKWHIKVVIQPSGDGRLVLQHAGNRRHRFNAGRRINLGLILRGNQAVAGIISQRFKLKVIALIKGNAGDTVTFELLPDLFEF